MSDTTRREREGRTSGLPDIEVLLDNLVTSEQVLDGLVIGRLRGRGKEDGGQVTKRGKHQHCSIEDSDNVKRTAR